MSRLGAGIVGAVSAAVGAMLGAGVALEIHGDKVAFGPMLPREQKTAAKGAAIGGLLGAALGAGLSAGSDAPKQVGTSGAPGLLGEWGVGAASISVAGGGFYTAPVGSIVTLESPGGLWQSPGVLTSDATVLAPSNPSTTNSFVAVAPGIALLSGTTSDGRIASARVTVVSSEAVQPTQSKLSTGEIVGISAAGATALGGVVYLATRKPKRRRRR